MVKSWMVVLLGCLLCVGVTALAAEEKEKKEKKEKKEEKKPVALPDTVSKAVNDCCKDAKVEECKEVKDGDKVCYEVKCKDKSNEGCKMLVAADGKVIEESKHKVPTASLPAAVLEAAKKWAPTAKMGEMATVETKKDSGTVYEVKSDLFGKIFEAKIGADGKVLKADKLPGTKAEKKEKKEEKKG